MQENPIVILTREMEDNLIIAEKLSNKGIKSFNYPCIKVSYKDSFPEDIKSKFENAELFIFSSRRGIRGFKLLFEDIIKNNQKIAVIGKSSGDEVKKELGRKPDLISEIPTGESLAYNIIKQFDPSDNMIFIRGSKTSGIIKKILNEAGLFPIEFEVYKNDSPVLEPLSILSPAIILFASPSAVKCFFKYNKNLKTKWIYLAIGPTTAQYIRSLDHEVIEASDPNVDSIVTNIEEILLNSFENLKGD